MIKSKVLFFLSLSLVLRFIFHGGLLYAGEITIIDSQHYSSILGEMRNYRIFLPPGYFENPGKRYPVIYFMHGWSQRYFGMGPLFSNPFEKGDDNKGDNIANYVSGHEVIVVKSDGYNKNPDEEYYLRPYNIGMKSEVETYRQFPIYYPELVNFIDATYNTIPDREHRAITGLSMGGFMCWWIGGKYPQLFSAAGNFCGSAEFFVGPRNFPVEYHHKDMYKNFGGMNLRLNYGNKDFIRSYHEDINKIWTQVTDNYEYKIYDAAHTTCGLGEMFDFCMKTFENPPEKPARWAHIDVYPEFTAWDYHVNSDRNVPGFTILENVDKSGFRCSVREFLPDGELLPFVNVVVTTPPVYEKNQTYVINDIDTKRLKSAQKTILSDNSGRLKISMNGGLHEIGINRKNDRPGICIASIEIENMPWAISGKDVKLVVTLLNKGLANGKNISAGISATRNTAEIINPEASFGNININEIKTCISPFVFRVNSDSIEMVQFRITIMDNQKNQWSEFVEIPIKRDLPEQKNFAVADGKIFTVAKAGDDSETILLGDGNGDGVANPGESIVILIKDQDIYHRAGLSYNDKYLDPFGIHQRMSDDWMKYDYVGASEKYSVPLVASDCPENQTIELFAEYWLPDNLLHSVKQEKVKIEVKGTDSTPPKLSWVQIPGNNTLYIKLYDGSKIQTVKARLILREKDKPEVNFTLELNDDGLNGDRESSDNVFSAAFPQQKLGFYRVLIEAKDSFGNIMIEEAVEKYLLH